MARATTSTTGTTSPNRPVPSSPFPTRKRGGSGFTLWELLLALGILLVLAAITWPVVYRVFDDYRLKKSAQTAWTEITATRMQAIETCATWQFRYEMGGQKWLAVPQDGSAALLEMASSDVDSADSIRAETRTGELPEEMSFAAASDGTVVVEELSQEAFAGLADAESLASVRWSSPIVFFADGSSYDDSLRVMDDEGRSILLSIRGLTGEVEIGSVDQGAMQ